MSLLSLHFLRTWCAGTAALLLPLPSAHALGGDGAPEIDSAQLTAHVHVSAQTGNDANDGSQAAPCRTLLKGLQRAAQFNAANQGVTVHLAPGSYLEGGAGSHTAMYFPGLSTSAPVVVQGQGWSPGVNTGDVILTGSEVWTSWASDGGGVWSKPWPYQMKIEPSTSFGDVDGTIVPEVVRLMSGLFVNNERYYIFRSATDPDMVRLSSSEGAYWIDLGPDSQRGGGDDFLRVKPPVGLADLNAAAVQVTTRGHLLHFWRPSAQAEVPTSIVFRNLVVQHSGASGLIFQNHGGVILEDMLFRDNKWRGVTIESPNMPATVRRSVFTGNGEQTIATRGTGMLYEDLIIQNNARQSWLVRYIGWGTGAFKIGFGRDTTFRRIRSLDNWGLGAWFDTGCLRCELTDSVISGNANTALFIENNNSWNIPDLGGDPTVVVHNTAIINNRRPSGESGATPGVQIGETENAVIRHSLIAGNDVQLRINSILDRGPQRHNQFHDSLIASTSSSQPLWLPQWGVAGWRSWFDTLNSTTNHNTYVHPNTNAFRDRNASDTLVSFSAWKSAHLSNPYNASANKAVDANSTHSTASHTVRPFVSIAPLHDYLSESAEATPSFRVFRLAADISSALTVNYTIRSDTGDALNGSDYVSIPGTITIPAGALFADITLDPLPGDGAEPLEPVVLTLSSNPPIYQLGRFTATVSIDDENGSLSSISVAASRPHVGEGSGATGQWTFTRTGAAQDQLTIQFTVSSTATAGIDFVPLPSTVTFAADASQAMLDLTAIDNATPELLETVTVTVQPQAGLYGVVSGAGSATVNITDNDVISLAAIEESVAAGAAPVTVPLTLYNPGSSPATFTISPPDQPYTWGASSLLTAPAYAWEEIIDNPDPAQNGEVIPGPGAYVNYDNAAGFTEGMFTWSTWYTNGYSGGWYRHPLPNNSSNASRGAGTLPLGFNFPYYGQNHSAVFLHSNGFLAVTDDPAGYQWSAFKNRVEPVRWHAYSRGLPSSDEAAYPTPRGAISAFWNDMTFIHDQSRIVHKSFTDRFVVTWRDMGYRNDIAPYPSRFTFQTVLYQNGDIDFQYQRIDRPYGSTPGTVGLTNPDITRSVLVSYNDGFIDSGLRIRMKYQPTWASTFSKTVTIPAGGSATIQLTLDPANLSSGIHRLQIPITSTDPLMPPIILPVSLGVGDLAGILRFGAASVTIDEAAGILEIPVSRVSGSTGAVSASYRTTMGGTATPNADFVPVSGSLTWSEGDLANRIITVPIQDDHLTDGDRTFTVELHDAMGGASIGSPESILITIRDNDRPVSTTIPAFTAIPVTSHQIDLSWSAVENAAAYRIERSTDGGVTWQSLVAGLSGASPAFTDAGLVPGTIYHYRIQAFNPVSESNWRTTSATTATAGDFQVNLASSKVYENSGMLAGTVTRGGALDQSMIVNLSSSSARAMVPASVTIPAGQRTVDFAVSLLDDGITQGANTQVIISASSPGSFASESFDDAFDSALHGTAGGMGWTTPWTDTYTPPKFAIRSGGLSYPGWSGSGGFAEGSLQTGANNAWRDLTVTRNSGVFYFGVLMQLKPGSYRSDLYFGFDEGDHSDARNWMNLRFRLTRFGVLEYHNGAYPTVWTPTSLTTASGNNEQVNLLVGRLDYGPNNRVGGGDDSMRLWLNPVLDGSANEPAGGLTIPIGMIAITRISISGEWTNSRYDEIRLANTFAGLTGTTATGQGQFALADDESLAGIAAWRDTAFGNPADSGIAANSVDPDADGIPNLLEYALAGDPLRPGGNGVSAGTNSGYLTISFTYPAAMNDVVLEVEASEDLLAWTRIWSSAAAANALRLGVVSNGDGTATTTVRDTSPMSGMNRRFLRLRALTAR